MPPHPLERHVAAALVLVKALCDMCLCTLEQAALWFRIKRVEDTAYNVGFRSWYTSEPAIQKAKSRKARAPIVNMKNL